MTDTIPPQPLSSGLKTEDWRARQPPCLHVTWLEWDSPFRATGLRPGDQILQLQRQPLPLATETVDRLPGRLQEAALWLALGLRDGDPLCLTVRRRATPQGWQVLEFAAPLRALPVARDESGRTLVGLGGPQRLARDGFSEAWAPWLERRRFEWERQLDGTVWAGTTDTRQALARHLEAEPRVRYLAAHYPGPFSDAVLQDWTALRDSLAGRCYPLTAADSGYRDAERQMVKRVSELALQAWQAALAAHAGDTIEPPGEVRMTEGMHERVAGKLLVLPRATPD
ncbi:hypothetical protein WDZ92_43950, partial [Nostoc sp. NIES-2111]